MLLSSFSVSFYWYPLSDINFDIGGPKIIPKGNWRELGTVLRKDCQKWDSFLLYLKIQNVGVNTHIPLFVLNIKFLCSILCVLFILAVIE